jgi:hypothetical protein
MKKNASILVIISSFIFLVLEFFYYFNALVSFSTLDTLDTFAGPFFYIGLILLGFALLKEGGSSNTIQSETSLSQEDLNPNDIPSTGLNIVSFLIPLVGLIIYLTEKDKAPKKANAAGKAALWGVGISVLLGVISVIVSISMMS